LELNVGRWVLFWGVQRLLQVQQHEGLPCQEARGAVSRRSVHAHCHLWRRTQPYSLNLCKHSCTCCPLATPVSILSSKLECTEWIFFLSKGKNSLPGSTPYYLRAKATRHLPIKNNIDQPCVYGLVSYVIYQVGSSLVMIWHSVSWYLVCTLIWSHISVWKSSDPSLDHSRCGKTNHSISLYQSQVPISLSQMQDILFSREIQQSHQEFFLKLPSKVMKGHKF
jgi:hypothetical protein